MVLPKSDVWKYFTKINKNEAKCNICAKVLKTSGNTSNLKGHLNRHKLQDETGPKSLKKTLSSGNPPKQLSSSGTMASSSSGTPSGTSSSSKSPGTSSSGLYTEQPSSGMNPSSDSASSKVLIDSSAPGTSRQMTQPSIHMKFTDMKSFSEGGSRHCKITQSLLYFICKDYMPLSVVDGPGFRHLMKETVPLYKLPTRNTIKSLINKKFDALSLNFKSVLEQTEHFSITADCWSEMMTTNSFLGVTAHFIDSLSLESVSLGVVPLDQSHTAEYLGQQIFSTLRDWNIPLAKVCSIVTDNESSMVKAAADTFGKNKHIRCLAHTVNLLAESAISNTKGLSDLLKKVREIVKFFKRSVLASDQLREEQRVRGVIEGEMLKLKLDVSTRWNSKFFMIDRFLDLSNIVNNVLLSRPEAPPMLSAIELENLREVKIMLSFLEQLTREISGDRYVTASMAIPLLNCLIESINSSTPKLEIGRDLKISLQTEFDNRFKDREQAHLLALPMLLDPRFKNIHFSNPLAATRTLNQVKKLVASVASAGLTPGSSSDSENDTPMSDLWAHHKTLALKSNKTRMTHDTSVNLDTELSMYLSTPVSANHKANPLELWEDLKNIYPKLYILARQYLVSVATSVPSERLFSKAGATITERRNRLSGKMLSKLLFLNGLPDKYWR